MATPRFLLAITLALAWGGCTTDDDLPASFVVGLRVLAVVAEPPQVDPGGVSQISMLVVDTAGRPVDAAWSRCTVAPLSGEAVNPDCVTDPAALVSLGSGLAIAAEMPPAVTAAALGQPDATNGVYLPLVAQISDGEEAVTAVYRLRLGDGMPANMNPAIASIDLIDAAGGATPLDAAAPLIVHAGDKLTLAAPPVPGSAQTYVGVGGAAATERLNTSWFCTAGALSVARTSDSQPTTVLDLTENLPNAGEIVDLFAVVHDERGGVGYIHRVLELQ